MAIHDRDFMLVQRLNEPFKIEAQEAKQYFDTPLPVASRTTLGGVKIGQYITVTSDGSISAEMPHVLRFRGLLSYSDNAPTGATEGDVYVFNNSGTLNTSWGRLQGTEVNPRDMVLWDGVQWDIIGDAGAGDSLTGVAADEPIYIDHTIPHHPHIGVREATVQAFGVVKLASPADISLGSYGKVVDAAQLKVVADRIATGQPPSGGGGSAGGSIPANTFMPYDISTLRTLP